MENHTRFWITLLLGPALIACGDDGSEPAVDASTGSNADAGAGSDAPPTGAGELTVESCETAVAAGVPAFFASYFRCVDISMSGDSVVIRSEGLPPHRSYYYGDSHPNFEAFDYDRGAQYRPNPATLSEQTIEITIPLNPVPKSITIDDALVDGVVGTSDEEYGLGTVGVALDSVTLFNPLAAPGDDIEAEKYTFDNYNAHPAPNGAYHYHTNTPGPLMVLQAAGLVTTTALGEAEVEVFGIMCDGALVMGCTELDGSAPDGADFDGQNGHVHDLTDAAGTTHFTERYHTHICPETFPNHQYTPEIQYYQACGTGRPQMAVAP